jgi:hypothetical protein
MIEHRSDFDFPTTLQRCLDAIGAAGLTLFAQIDQAAAARTVGL